MQPHCLHHNGNGTEKRSTDSDDFYERVLLFMNGSLPLPFPSNNYQRAYLALSIKAAESNEKLRLQALDIKLRDERKSNEVKQRQRQDRDEIKQRQLHARDESKQRDKQVWRHSICAIVVASIITRA